MSDTSLSSSRNSSGYRLSTAFPEVLTTARFYVELTLSGSTTADAYFMECKGLKYSQDVIEVPEVTPQKWGTANKGLLVRTKIAGAYKVGNISLRRGMMSQSTRLWEWIQSVQEGNWGAQRRDGSLVVYRQDGEEGARFNILRAWPVSYNFSGTNVGASELAIEELELAVEDFRRVT